MFPRLPTSGNIIAETKFVKMFAKKLRNILVEHGLLLYMLHIFSTYLPRMRNVIFSIEQMPSKVSRHLQKYN